MGFQQPRLSPVVKILLILNVAVFVLQHAFSQFGDIPVELFFGFSPNLFFSGYVWQVVTYSFLHGNMWHILFNLFALYMFGNQLEGRWGGKNFLKYYLVCAVGGAILQTVIWAAASQLSASSAGAILGGRPTIGASGAVYGLMLAFGILYSNALLYVFGVLPVRAKNLVIGLICYELLSAVFFSSSGVAHLFHLGGMLAGYILLKVKGPNLTGGSGGFGKKRFGRKGGMSREEVRQRLRIVGNPQDDIKEGDKGLPITWN